MVRSAPSLQRWYSIVWYGMERPLSAEYLRVHRAAGLDLDDDVVERQADAEAILLPLKVDCELVHLLDRRGRLCGARAKEPLDVGEESLGGAGLVGGLGQRRHVPVVWWCEAHWGSVV